MNNKNFLYKIWIISCLMMLNMVNNSSAQKTYAIIVGISQYQSKAIAPLQYAHIDAQQFANYLTSVAGGQVPDSNIIVLLNEQATATAIYNALDWLANVCTPNDVVYFYFSGHGDMENKTIHKNGYLISYDTPPNNYLRNAVKIDDVNEYANTFSVQNKAKVILITDACHSGNLAGKNIRGSELAAEQMHSLQNNEIRMASCAANQVSVENSKWGGGRGVFSYYLLNGLQGLADIAKDGKVSLKEINNYINESLKNDAVLKFANQTQTPVIKGSEKFELATVDATTLQKLSNLKNDFIIQDNPLPKLKRDAATNFIYRLNNSNKNIEFDIPFLNLDTSNIKEIALDIIRISKDIISETEKKVLIELLINNPDAMARVKKALVQKIADRTQEIINLYLQGSEEEIERRRYYQNISDEYFQYPIMLWFARKMCNTKSPLTKTLEIKYHYLLGVAYRLKIPFLKDATKLIDNAFEQQSIALSLDENLAYIHNELGVLYMLKKDNTNAKKHFDLACDIAPTWSIPFSNLAYYSLLNKEIDKGMVYAKTADTLQKNYQGTYLNMGMLYEAKNNYLQAEEMYRKCVAMNSRYYLPFIRLGHLLNATTQYKLADSIFYESALRKLNFHLDMYQDGWGDGYDLNDTAKPIGCAITHGIADDDVISLTMQAIYYYEENKFAEAENNLLKILKVDTKNFIAYHYLGKCMWQVKNYLKAESYLQNAIQHYTSKTNFQENFQQLKATCKSKDECVIKNYSKAYYNKLEDNFILGKVYEEWRHDAEAETMYRQALATDSNNKACYYKLWQILETQSKYNEAENILLLFAQKFSNGFDMLNKFYERVTTALPDNADWFAKAGNFHYNEVISHPQKYNLVNYEPDKDVYQYFDDHELLHYDGQESEFIIGTKEIMDFKVNLKNQKTMTIYYFGIADSLLQYANITEVTKNSLADINVKMGSMYDVLQNSDRAIYCFTKAIALQKNNTASRAKLIQVLDKYYLYTLAQLHLDTLAKTQQINFKQLVLQYKYQVLSQKQLEAKATLQKIMNVDPAYKTTIENLQKLNEYLGKNYSQAITMYQAQIASNTTDANAMYTIARMYYLQNKTSDAYLWLEKAIKNGFKYFWILRYDAVWEKERETAHWKLLTQHIKMPNIPKENPIKPFIGG